MACEIVILESNSNHIQDDVKHALKLRTTLKREITINMEYMPSNLKVQNQLISSNNILFIQDIDGVCIPLVKDPMTRKLESKYIYAVKEFAEEFFVLTLSLIHI